MASNQKSKDVQAYPPTSLDFINRPNPVEPLAAPPKHPLHGSTHLHNAYTHDLRRLLLDTIPRDAAGEATAKRLRQDDDGSNRSSGNSQARDLPSLPKLPVRSGGGSRERRRRLPPTLSGLHQPPPNAGLLPSINVQQPRQDGRAVNELTDEPRNVGTAPDLVALASTTKNAETASTSLNSSSKTKNKKPAKNKWSDEETADLLKGVAKFGIGSWTKILKCEDYNFERRTALDLKDRFRVCCPEHYRKPKSRPPVQAGETLPKPRAQIYRNDRKGASELAEMGIEGPFQKVTRRSRHAYTKEQDDALLRGFRKHGKSWAAILKDEEVLSERTSTDLRDRFRVRFPQEYSNVGLAPRPEVFPRPPDRGLPDDDSQETQAANSKRIDHRDTEQSLPTQRSEQPISQITDPPSANRSMHFNSSLPNDVFFGLPADDDDMDTEPLVLDRGILDWAFESTRPSQQETTSTRRHRTTNAMPPPSTITTNPGVTPASLPSLATITAVSADNDQLELPSLMQYFESIEGDTRTGGHGFLAVEDLLSQT